MSYILEALRKAEQLRRRGDVPGLDAMQAPPAAQRNPWPAKAWIALVGVNLLLLGVLFWPDADEPDGVDPARESAATNEATVDSRSMVPPPPAPRSEPGVVVSLRPIPPPPPPAPKPRGTVTYAPVETPDVEVTPPVPAQSDVAATPPAAAVPPPPVTDTASDLPTWPQVPPALFAKLGDGLRLDVHVYANNPSERFVLMNLQKYREGEVLREGPVLEAITPEGVVLSFRGQRFRMLAK